MSTFHQLPHPKVCQMVLHAWVGEDERGSGVFGLKQGMTPVGLIPLVSCMDGRMEQDYIVDQMRAQNKACGKRLYLARFVFEAVDMTVAENEVQSTTLPGH